MSDRSSADWEHTRCPLCSEDRPRLLLRAPDRLYGFPGEFRLVRCGSCRHVYQDPRPTREAIGRFYPEDYGPHHVGPEGVPVEGGAKANAFRGANPWYLSPWARRIPGLRGLYYWLREAYAEVIPEPIGPAPRALEIGCGDGRFLLRLRAEGWQAEGIEPAEKAAECCRQRGFRVHRGTFEDQRWEPGIFDAVFAWMVLEHVHEPTAVMQGIRGLLKDGGYLALSVPNFGCWEPKVFRSFWYAIEPTHLQQFTPRTLKVLLHQTGFSIERLIHQRNVFNLVGSLGLLARRCLPRSRLGDRLIHFTDHPSMGGQLLLAPPAKLLAWIRQAGRLTVVCRVHK